MAIKSSNQITFTEHKKIIEIREWYLATEKSADVTIETEGWTTEIQTIDYINKYLWNYEEVVYSIGSSDVSDPVIIGFYGQGISGVGIADIQNYYQVTTEAVAPDIDSSWSRSVPLLTPTNKYLWNYEAIIYTDDTTTLTEPAIIGVYGDSGVDAITFEIYSTQGFIFKEGMDSIKLEIAAFQGENAIVDATYKWEWWDPTLNDGIGDYVLIKDNDIPFLKIYKYNEYAFAHLRCTMTYNEKTYEDHVDLTNETIIYSSMVKFFDGSNIFNASTPYIIAYVDLYKNNTLVDSVQTTQYYTGKNSVSSGIITTDISGTFQDGDLMYFIYNNKNNYQIALGNYQAGVWKVSDDTSEYIYMNDFDSDIISNIIVISKEKVSKSKEINFSVYKRAQDDNGNYIYNDTTFISTTSAAVIDINDPIVSDTEPENVNYGQLWLDISSNPYVLKVYTEIEGENTGRWERSLQQDGNVIYTSRPSKYSKGDLWILAENESCGSFGAGSMLKATVTSYIFNESHWIDADEEMTELKNNIEQYFNFDKNTGLRIGQKDEKFYVNISSTEMGFYDNSNANNPNQKVVNIGNSSATIKNAVVNDSATFNCNATFNQQINIQKSGTTTGFVWKIEQNGSLSLSTLS